MKASFVANATIFLGVAGLGIAPTTAQIVPDTTLRQNAIVAPSGNGFQIEGGTTAGTNLFHSFSEFSLPTHTEAYFNNSVNIENILARVTGDNISKIDGLIRANGTANLFLLNPNGIVFGENARLDMGGSFLGTTASSLVFENGLQFSATTAEISPLLSVGVPIGLQFNGPPGEIQVRGNGHDLTTTDAIFAPISPDNNRSGLQVDRDRTLALIGGDVRLEGATVTAAGGRIELGGVSRGFVGAVPRSPDSQQWHFDYTEVSDFRDVSLTRQSAADVSGIGIGSMQIVGRQITLSDGSIALLQNQGSQPFDTLRVQALESLTLTGMTPDGFLPSGFRSETVGIANASDIEIATRQLAIREGAQIFSRTQGDGNTGNIDIRASESIFVTGSSPVNPIATSLIANASFGSGRAGDITVLTGYLSLRDGAVLSTSTFAAGSSGNLLVNAPEGIEIIGIERRILSGSVISSTSFGSGNAGSVTIDTSRAILQQGGEIASSALASGDSGRILLNATEFVEVSGMIPETVNRSSINASASLASEEFRQAFMLPPAPSGSPGNVEINTPQLNVIDGGIVTVSNDGSGRAGNLDVNAETLFLNEGGSIAASTLLGEGGNIQLSLDDSLQLRQDSSISTEAGGTGNGGNIAINVHTISALENSFINANAFAGKGGNIRIRAEGIFLSPNSTIAASSQLGVDGMIEITNPEVDTQIDLIELASEPLAADDRISTGCDVDRGSYFVVAGMGGIPEDPTLLLRGTTVWEDLRPLENEVELESTELGNVNPTSLVEATSWQTDDRGKIELVATTSHPIAMENSTHCR